MYPKYFYTKVNEYQPYIPLVKSYHNKVLEVHYESEIWRERPKFEEFSKLNIWEDECKGKSHIQANQTRLSTDPRTMEGKQPLELLGLCFHSGTEQLPAGALSSWLGWTLLQDTHSNCVVTLHMHWMYPHRDLVSSGPPLRTHLPQLPVQYPTCKLGTDCLSKDQRVVS